MPTALITGILGQDGSYLRELLGARGYRVVGLDQVAPPAPLPGIEVVVGDVSDADAIARAFAVATPDEVYHLAGQTSVGRSFAEPAMTFRSLALSTLHVLEAARAAPKRPKVLVAGSGEVFGDTGGEPASESTPFRPVSPYGSAKAAVAHLTATYRSSFGLFACVAHFYNHESPRRPPHFVTQKIVRAACRIAQGAAERLTLGDTSVVRDFGWAPEYVEAATRMLAADAPRDFVIASGESVSLDAFVERVFAALGLRAAEHVTHEQALMRAAEIPVMRANPSAAAASLGWRAEVRLDDLIGRLIEAASAPS